LIVGVRWWISRGRGRTGRDANFGLEKGLGRFSGEPWCGSWSGCMMKFVHVGVLGSARSFMSGVGGMSVLLCDAIGSVKAELFGTKYNACRESES